MRLYEDMTARQLRRVNRRNAAGASRPGWCRREKRVAIYIRDGLRCAYCGTDLRDAKPCEMGLDHLVPWIAGGSNDPANLVLSCRSCNSSRKAMPWRQFATGGAIRRIERLRRRKLNMALAKAILNGEAKWGDA